MSNGIIEYLTEGFFWYFQLFYALHAFIMDGRSKVLSFQYIHHTVCHLNDITLYHILSYQVCLVLSETSNFKLHTSKVALRFLGEKE